MNQEINNQEEGENFSIREELDKYLIHWYWFVISATIVLISAYIYIRYKTEPAYKANITILVKDDKKGGMNSEMAAFSDLALLTGAKSNVDNEVEILKSRTLVENVVKRLELNVFYIAQGRVKESKVYKGSPITVEFLDKNKKFYEANYTFNIKSNSATLFNLVNETDELIGAFKYGALINTKLGYIKVNKNLDEIEPNKKQHNNPDFNLKVRVVDLHAAVNSIQSRLTVGAISKTTSVIDLSLNDAVAEEAEDFLNMYVQMYNEEAVADKNFISLNTSNFINERLKLLSVELDDVEKDVENFKEVHKLTNISSEADAYSQSAIEYEKEIVETDIKTRIINSMLDFLAKSTAKELLPHNLINLEGSSAAQLINEYNMLLIERERLLKSSTISNPVIVALDRKVAVIKEILKEDLIRYKVTLNIKKENLKTQEDKVNVLRSKIPRQEREFRIIKRQQEIKEALYLYLLQKREETAISLAVTEPNAKVIDVARADKKPVSPKKSIIYLGAFIVGLLIPFGVIYLRDLLDTKIKSRLDIEGKVKVPFLGDVPNFNSPHKLIPPASRTSTAEAMRIVRTNLEFMLNVVPKGIAKTIFVTSTFTKEGKTFISANLAGTLSLSGSKVLLIGMDIRNPKLDEYMQVPTQGVTNFLASTKKPEELDNYIVKINEFQNLYALSAGTIPPNPAELLMSKKVNELFEYLKTQYDYIVVDTAPVSLVTDTLLIANHADTFIYVARANYLDKRMLAVPDRLYKEKKLPNMFILLNDTNWKNTYGYGYGYGYGVDFDKEQKNLPWFKRMFK